MTWRAALRALVVPAALVTACSRIATVGVVDDDAGTGDAQEADASDGRDASGGQVASDTADAGAGPQPSATATKIDDCTATSGLALTDISALKAGGPVMPGMRWLYPYDQTVFPEGVGAPLLMWEGPEPQAVFVHMYGTEFEYSGCLPVDASRRLQLPQRAWTLAETATRGQETRVTLELTSIANTQVSGPIRQQLTIADEPLRGAVYYMSYGTSTQLTTAAPSLLRVRPGNAAERVFSTTTCAGCHAVSSDGGHLLSYVDGLGKYFELPEQTAAAPNERQSLLTGAELAALTPDGALYAAPAHPNDVGPRAFGVRNLGAGLYESATGTLVADSGLPEGAMMPAFSADGTLLAFSDAASAAGRSLSLMRFSVAERRASDYRVIVTSDRYAGWPTFVPSKRALVFALSDAADSSGGGFGVTRAPAPRVVTSDIHALGLSADAQPVGSSRLLARAMGFASERAAVLGDTYLPFGAEDLHRNYYPNVSPEPIGGYYWLFFDSARHYGNQGLVRQIWVAALDVSIDGSPSMDGSHPAFRLPGQEVGAGNMRPFLAARRP